MEDYLSTKISLKSSFFPSFFHSWIAFFIARRPMSEAKRRRGDISVPICSWTNVSSSPSISASCRHSSISPVIDTQAVAMIDIYPSKENSLSIFSSSTRKTSTTSAQTRFVSRYRILACSRIPLFGGFCEYSMMSSWEDTRIIKN